MVKASDVALAQAAVEEVGVEAGRRRRWRKREIRKKGEEGGRRKGDNGGASRWRPQCSGGGGDAVTEPAE